MIQTGVINHKCKNCNAPLKFNPQGQNWKCEYCRSEFTKAELDEYEANSATYATYTTAITGLTGTALDTAKEDYKLVEYPYFTDT